MPHKDTKRKDDYCLPHEDLTWRKKKQSIRTPPSAKTPILLRDEVTEGRDVATYPVLVEWAASFVRTGEVADSSPLQGSEINLIPLDEAQARFPGLPDGSDDEIPGSDPGESFLIFPWEGKQFGQREEPGPPMADADHKSPAGLIEGENEESLLPIDGVSLFSLPIHGLFKIDVSKNKTAHVGS
jgi:hypothetical protein